MSELLGFQGWVHGSLASPARGSSPSRTTASHRFVSKAKSSNALSDIAGTKTASVVTPSLNTLPDPRLTRMTSTPELATSGASTPHHPDLSNEIASLSDKLIRAINHQTNLDDALTASRQELEATRDKVRRLELDVQNREDDIASGVMVKRADIEMENTQLQAALEDERQKRSAIEKDKKNIEQELETLTAALFEEANQMVAAASKEREATERKNEQLRSQIKETESLLASHQEQLAELKQVMQQITADQDDFESHTNGSTAPSSPALRTSHDVKNRLPEASSKSPSISTSGDIAPAPSLSFPQLVKPACRTDTKSYEDFNALLQVAKASKPASRVPSGSYAGLSIMSLPGLGLNAGSNGLHADIQPGHLTSPADRSTPGTPISGSVSPRDFQPPAVPLKETRFYKRVLTEDIEPALRLDIAPGVSWLTRRAFFNSICEGALVVEPMPTVGRLYLYSCSLCGESRKGEVNSRTHRFRTSDNETAQRHPLCVLCLEKVRASCDLVGYLKVLKDGHVRVEDSEEEKDAWEETIRLRERLFWSRIGGGVVPALLDALGSEKGADTCNLANTELQGTAAKEDDRVVALDHDQAPLEDMNDPPAPNASKFSMGKRLMSRLSYGNLRSVTVESGMADREPEPAIVEKAPQDQSLDNVGSEALDNSNALLKTIPGSFS